MRTFRATSIVNWKAGQMILSVFPWLLMSQQMFLILLSCCIFEKSVLTLKWQELFFINSSHRITIGVNIFKQVEEILIEYNLGGIFWDKTYYGENMCGAEKDLDKLTELWKCEAFKVYVLHCIICQLIFMENVWICYVLSKQ